MVCILSEEGIKLIQSFEGLCLTPYKCPRGYWTIGYGHVLEKEEEGLYHKGISKEKAYEFLEVDIYKTDRAVRRLIEVTLTQNQIDALVSFTFNVGPGALQRSGVRRLINREEHNHVPKELLKWVWSGGRKHKGLILRRKKEGEVYEGSS